MPVIVDPEERRTALCALAARIIAREGLEFATVRRIAQEAGYSTKIVSHYFSDKRLLLMATYRFAAEESSSLAEATQANGADVARFAISLLPIDTTMLKNWKVWLAFWSFAISDKDFATEQRRQVRRTRDRLMELLGEDERYTHLTGEVQRKLARSLLTQIIGLSLQAVFDPRDWPKERQIEAVTDTLSAAGARPR